jgi:hypothetical protein
MGEGESNVGEGTAVLPQVAGESAVRFVVNDGCGAGPEDDMMMGGDGGTAWAGEGVPHGDQTVPDCGDWTERRLSLGRSGVRVRVGATMVVAMEVGDTAVRREEGVVWDWREESVDAMATGVPCMPDDVTAGVAEVERDAADNNALAEATKDENDAAVLSADAALMPPFPLPADTNPAMGSGTGEARVDDRDKGGRELRVISASTGSDLDRAGAGVFAGDGIVRAVKTGVVTAS